MRLKEFLDKYDTVIFDMDGVITNEQNYWNAAALTVWEYLKRNRSEQVDASYGMEHCRDIRVRVFCSDELISVLKSKGVNSNWDLGYVTVLISWICGGRKGCNDFRQVLEYAKKLSGNILDEYDSLAEKCSEKTGFDYDWLKRGNLMWKTMQIIFQEWFLGDGLFFAQYGNMPLNSGKTGLLNNEEPIIPMDGLREMLRLLSADKRVCMGTGRPSAEILRPLESWDIMKYFAADGLCNYDHVINAEKTLNNNSLAKPHPYMFLKALFGTDYPDEKIADGIYDREKIKTTLIVGDAGADILAAQAMGADFCAVLTGIQGKAAREYFESMKADYILDSISDLCED